MSEIELTNDFNMRIVLIDLVMLRIKWNSDVNAMNQTHCVK